MKQKLKCLFGIHKWVEYGSFSAHKNIFRFCRCCNKVQYGYLDVSTNTVFWRTWKPGREM